MEISPFHSAHEPSTATLPRENVRFTQRNGTIPMSHNWMTTAEAVTMISKHSHHQVSPHYVQTLVNRGKIGTRSFPEGTALLKRSDVQATQVAVGKGHSQRQ